MPEDFLHGVNVVEVESGPRPVDSVSSAIIGVIGTASDATASAFPLNTPVLVTGSAAEITALSTEGTLPTALSGILAQTSANIVVVRIADGEAHDEVTA
jgi:phage tail sheath protein FI